MLLAEAVTFDPGLVVALFVIFLLVCAAAIAVIVTGICAGYRAGRDPNRTRAAAAWWSCLAIDAVVFLITLAVGAPIQMLATIAVVTGLTWLAHRVGAGSATGAR